MLRSGFLLILSIVTLQCVFGQAPPPQNSIDAFFLTPELPRPNWSEDYEADVPSWRLLHAQNPAALQAQARVSEERFQGQRSEAIGTRVLNDSCAVFGHDVGFPLVIEDLNPTVFVKTQGDGMVLGAQIVLPHSIHPETGQPVTFLVPGQRHSGSGKWENLGFRNAQGQNNLLDEVRRRGRFLRAEMSAPLNLDDCYIRQLVLLVEPPVSRPLSADPKRSFFVDALEIFGHVAIPNEIYQRSEVNQNGERHFVFDPVNFDGFRIETSLRPTYIQPHTSTGAGWEISRDTAITARKGEPLRATPQGAALPKYASNLEATRSTYTAADRVDFSLTNERVALDGSISPAALMQIRLSGQVLTINNIPIGVRAVEYNGEPLAFLRELKFNTVWVRDITPALLKEAQDAGVWIICSPPTFNQLRPATVYPGDANVGGMANTTSTLSDPIYDNVLAWNLGDECANPSQENNAVAQWSQEIQRADRARRRPIICTPLSGVREYGGRIANILMMRQTPILSSLEFSELARWQQNYRKLARPDTPFWGTIQTQPSLKLTHQWIMYEGNPQAMCAVSYEQMKMQIFQGIASGLRGFLFQSHSPLNANDPETEYRRTALELLNWELQMIEEWFASGEVLVSSLPTNHRQMGFALLRSGRSRLMIPLWNEPKSQMAVGPAFVGNASCVVSVPETYSAYHLVPGRLLPLDSPRIAGGVKLELEEANLNSVIFFSEDDSVYARTEQRTKKLGDRAAFLACRLAELQLALSEQVLTVLKQAQDFQTIPRYPEDHQPLINLTENETLIRQTKEAIDRSKDLLQRSPSASDSAFLQAEKATRGLRWTARNLLLNATRHELHACMTPTSVSFATLPYYLTAYQRLRGGTLSQNRLVGGDMEDIATLEGHWQVAYHGIDGVAPTRRTLSSKAARSGQLGLQLVVTPTDATIKPEQLETVPVWVSTPPVEVRRGEMICVNGWVRIPRTLESTSDGFMVFDSLGDNEMALRFKETRGQWQEFALYRIAPEDSAYYAFFALAGFGEVHLDDVTIAAVQFEQPATPAPVAPAESPSGWQRLNPLPYIIPQRPLFGSGE